MRTTIAAVMLAAATTGAAAEPISLACEGRSDATGTKGTLSFQQSMGIQIDLDAGTVAGDWHLFGRAKAHVTAATDTTVQFASLLEFPNGLVLDIHGEIDRVSGDLVASHKATWPEHRESEANTTFLLKCRPTQRMF